ncbi:MAG: hypothetical protein UX02_C0001G0258 [Candidatus Moranbacteria bacterium GW2011_GWC1_45_18]|nr:MAG: hypothetical protein UT79_C0002G0139 [Candidatus Moranbacteria bacterium GW2011_GWC2_40_12]KKT33488.1 MAG: hypothetical protein UW19_C0008G0031 [Candidatus Moranbacteria bacterium GW2011_GWF2_44_10]KKT72209.1 MAG: hypothetical protein UW66_C0010G0008 [Candidatus Moranbacteria bacterium GW2011_GWF1_44_4]KKU00810.1 MAG: hypothetical protein UX02_C0001G0258 [Candidatus Moranbacteria bacterium GW2011_GWC1_45_18]OGI24774.1 MAG: hypothetical protein A2194_04505 [Candidatus Moranbacteria bacte
MLKKIEGETVIADAATEKKEDEKQSLFTAHIIRHSASQYKNYARVEKSETPTGPVDYKDQVFDLTEQGIEIALQAAVKFFDQFDPQKDAFLFFSSEEDRSLSTTKIYLEEAERRGFEIIRHDEEKRSGKHVQDIPFEKIRVIRALGLSVKDALLIGIYNPDKYLRTDINWEALEEIDVKEKWMKSREIINADDQGSWWGNYYRHSEAIQQLFPHAITAKDKFEKQFSQIIKLIEHGAKVHQQNHLNHSKNIRVVGNSHVDVFGYFLNEYFQKENGNQEIEMKNCEEIRFRVDDDGKVIAQFRDFEEKEIK